MSARQADVVVIGLGAAGGLCASQLALAGLHVVGLEAGDWHHAGEFAMDDIAQLGRNSLGAAKVNGEVPTFRQAPGQEAERALLNVGNLMMNGVGGSKTHSTNISWRLSPWNFRARSETIERHQAIPERSTLVDWPFGYHDLEPYYTRVERWYGVSGVAGNVGGVPTGEGNPFEGKRSEAYPSPPLRRSGWTELMKDAATSLGWSPFPTPASIRSVERGGKKACQYCGFCTWNGCWADAKAVPSSIGIPEAVETGRLDVRTGARAVSIDVDRHGAASGVTYVRNGQTHRIDARLVILATFTYENVRLLLLSESARFPHGLSNGSGQVGKHFMTHTFLMGFGRFPGKQLNAWSGSNAQGTAVADFDAANADHPGFVGGGVIMAGHEIRPMLHHRFAPPGVPRWGRERKRWLAENLGSLGWTYTLPDELPYEDHYLDLDPHVTDEHGLPVVRVTQSLRPNEIRQYEFLLARTREWFEAAGAAQFWHSPIAHSPVTTHAYGGTRMGEDPATSVVDPYGFSHEVPGLVIAGASTFPTSGGVNPTETVEALTWRTADRILETWSGV
ncbi:GMC family oxidoreductase [Amycolatopsis jejuensis]|uniref:GMC family oxidoreductase n=1 Tax=Amycolatopsis jejuensis TaxID=330084 RepID=UPI00052652CE|nr:GMC family oxidoreductase [Amycolatopsis jejuensis]